MTTRKYLVMLIDLIHSNVYTWPHLFGLKVPITVHLEFRL